MDDRITTKISLRTHPWQLCQQHCMFVVHKPYKQPRLPMNEALPTLQTENAGHPHAADSGARHLHLHCDSVTLWQCDTVTCALPTQEQGTYTYLHEQTQEQHIAMLPTHEPGACALPINESVACKSTHAADSKTLCSNGSGKFEKWWTSCKGYHLRNSGLFALSSRFLSKFC